MKRRVLITGGSGFIGTNLIDYMSAQSITVYNVDIRPPVKREHLRFWKKGDILDRLELREIIHEVDPSEVVHLAARTDTNGTTVNDYRSNTVGTANLLQEVKDRPSIERAIITSTQFVHRPGSLPQHDTEFAPHTIYGQSKVECEQMTRATNLQCTWTIIRPTNIWGPWHPRYPNEFWRVLKKGLYVHPGSKPVVRSYGYVRNVVHQIAQILEAPPTVVNTKVFYVGDPPGPILDWVNAFSKALTGRDVLIVPRCLVRALSIIGDSLSALRVPFPIYSSRFESMTQDYLTPMDSTFATFGLPPFSLEFGVKETLVWLKAQDDFWQ